MDPTAYKTVQTGVSSFWASKHARESSKNWDKFYRRNHKNFYKDRHWTSASSTDGFPQLSEQTSEAQIVIEAGCGVANCAFPLLKVNPSLYIYMFDFAPSAVQLVQQADQYNKDRSCAFLWDFCKHSIDQVEPDTRPGLSHGVADYCMLIFVLSAVPPSQQLQGLRHLTALLKPGGRLLFRDYAAGDMAQSRFANRNRIADNYFVRQDNTLSYFFDEQRLETLFSDAGLQKDYVRRVNRVIVNRKENKEMHRVFLQAVYYKPQG